MGWFEDVGLMLGKFLAASALASSYFGRSHDCGAPRVNAENLSAPAEACEACGLWFCDGEGRGAEDLGGGGKGNCGFVVDAGLGLVGLGKP